MMKLYRWRCFLVSLSIVGLVGAAACGSEGNSPPLPDPGVAVMTPSASEVTPGESITVRRPKAQRGTGTGVWMDLLKWDGSQWEHRYVLKMRTNAGDAPTWSRVPEDQEVVYTLVGFTPSEERPIEVIIPDVADPGQYRACTAVAEVRTCARIEVIGTS